MLPKRPAATRQAVLQAAMQLLKLTMLGFSKVSTRWRQWRECLQSPRLAKEVHTAL